MLAEDETEPRAGTVLFDRLRRDVVRVVKTGPQHSVALKPRPEALLGEAVDEVPAVGDSEYLVEVAMSDLLTQNPHWAARIWVGEQPRGHGYCTLRAERLYGRATLRVGLNHQ